MSALENIKEKIKGFAITNWAIGNKTASHPLPGSKDQADRGRHLARQRTHVGSRRLLGNCWRDEHRRERDEHRRNEMFEHD